MESNEIVVEPKPMLPVRIWRGFTAGISEILGQLTTKEFWVKLAKVCAKEMVSAFLKTLGGKFLSYGISREDPDVKKAVNTASSSAASTAFGSGGYTPRAEYPRASEYGSSTYRSYPVPVATQPEANFPGFGSK